MPNIVDLLTSSSPLLSVGIISADLMHLERDIRILEQAGGCMAHFDVMDGCLVPLLTAGPFFVKATKTSMLKDVHLMIDRPLDSLEAYAAAGADIITISAESTDHLHRALQRIHELPNANDASRGSAAGVGINPGTSLSVLEPVIELVDVVTILAVNPGCAGQSFIEASLQRCAEVRRMAAAAGRSILVCIDGGVTCGNIAHISSCKPDILVSGSAIFSGAGPAENVRMMRGAMQHSANERVCVHAP